MWLTCLRNLQSCLLHIGWPWTLPVISNHISVVSHRNAFICLYSNFSPKIGCHGNAPLSLVYGSVRDEFHDSTALSKTKLCIDMLHTTEVMATFVIFLPILAKVSLPWQRPLDPYNQKCLLWIGWPRKLPAISNHVLVISHRNAFICIYSNVCPKIGCHVNAPFSLVYVSVTNEFSDGTNPISKQNSVSLSTEDMVFVIFAYFGQHWLSWQRPLDPCNQKCLPWIGRLRKPPVISNCILVISYKCIYMYL